MKFYLFNNNDGDNDDDNDDDNSQLPGLAGRVFESSAGFSNTFCTTSLKTCDIPYDNDDDNNNNDNDNDNY